MPTAVGSGTVDCCGKAGVLLRAEHVLVLRSGLLGEKGSLGHASRQRAALPVPEAAAQARTVTGLVAKVPLKSCYKALISS